LGTALAGAVLAAHLHGSTADVGHLSVGVLQIAELPAAQRALVLDAYRAGLCGAFTVGAVIAGLGFLTVLFLPERPLRGVTALEQGPIHWDRNRGAGQSLAAVVEHVDVGRIDA
jgi:hypothetical protein